MKLMCQALCSLIIYEGEFNNASELGETACIDSITFRTKNPDKLWAELVYKEHSREAKQFEFDYSGMLNGHPDRNSIFI